MGAARSRIKPSGAELPALDDAADADIARLLDDPAMRQISLRGKAVADEAQSQLKHEEGGEEHALGAMPRCRAHRHPADDEIEAPEREHGGTPGMKPPPEQRQAENAGEEKEVPGEAGCDALDLAARFTAQANRRRQRRARRLAGAGGASAGHGQTASRSAHRARAAPKLRRPRVGPAGSSGSRHRCRYAARAFPAE